MKNLTLQQLVEFVEKCKGIDMPLDTPIFLGDDDELNGIHTAWYIQLIDKESDDDQPFMEMIDDGHNVEAKKYSILIS